MGLVDPASHPGPAETRRIRATVAYDGRPFRGFARQQGQRTVAGEIARAVARVCGHDVDVTCAGRTDAGVHAWGQVIHMDLSPGVDLGSVQRRCNKMLAPAIVIRDICTAPPGFDARRSAISRSYRYAVLAAPLPDPFLAGLAWHVAHPLDLGALRLACDPLVGEHDFSAFCRRPRAGAASTPDLEPATPSLVRRVQRAGWSRAPGDLLFFEIEANAFCHQMVRSLVGTLVDVGVGRIRAGDIAAIVAARDRSFAGQLAPPDGLYLLDVAYGKTGGDHVSRRSRRVGIADLPATPYR